MLVHDTVLLLLAGTHALTHYNLQVPENYKLQRDPIQLHGDVTSGFGRGSKQLGFATANLPPEPLAQQLEGLPKGVYFGWVRINRQAEQSLHCVSTSDDRSCVS